MQDDRNIPVEGKKRRKRSISPKVVYAIELWASGRARTQLEAASMASISPEWLSKVLKTSQAGVLIDEMSKKMLRLGKVRAASRVVELLDHNSGRVSLEASRLVLAVGGISAPRDGINLSVDINAQVGYVLDLRDPGPRVIDIPPTAEHPSAAALAPSRGYDE
jgi:hypothetical protein